jgi:hypothetical protein
MKGALKEESGGLAFLREAWGIPCLEPGSLV